MRMLRINNQVLRCLWYSVFLFVPVATFGEAVATECFKAFISDPAWRKDNGLSCVITCVSSQKATLATFDCPFKKMCEDFCFEDKKNVPDKKRKTVVVERDCSEISHPSLWTKIKKWPKNPINAIPAYFDSEKASVRARELFPPIKEGLRICYPVQNGKGDAFRHCYWSCLMTRRLGKETAADYADYREFTNPDPCEEAVMDDHNNQVGRAVGESAEDCEKGCRENKDLLILSEEGECH